MTATVTSNAAVEVRAVGQEAFEDIYPLLLDFKSTTMAKEDWRRMLFAYPWRTEPTCGYALFAEGRAVGFMGTIWSQRYINGRLERFCNASAWIVREPYRSASILLLKPLLALRDHTILQLTPNATAYQIFEKLGFKELESEQLLLPPVPARAGDLRALAGASFATSRESVLSGLSADERTIYHDLAGTQARHVVLRRGDRRCYLVATPSHRKGLIFADVHYIGDIEFFWEHRLLAAAAFLRAMGAAALVVDGRFARGFGRQPASRRPAKRLYRPSHAGVTPGMIDGLYSEWMFLRA